ncbi:hypothetical protein NDI85_19705 [Halomicroarcula sp. S1AR25-4]|uniref:hypothetical protein n=1 Tax=Haloarcula sp. S1AR25-4 TaxID=2950538 RepID=UPI0028757FCB|nr:hypothetical protein [Halomicroarcula sp. S1AR25-4]MDS0280014.1 hypothetical protein [Halomicroarcula sp. S1AR25-4]
MKETDHSILEVLSQASIPVQRGTILWYINNSEELPDTSKTTFYRRIDRLVYAGLVDEIDERFFALSDLGKRYLSEDLTSDEQMDISERLKEGPPDDD